MSTGIPSFEDHKLNDHNMWNYVYFLVYLRKKDTTEHNGIESYVVEQANKVSP